ncbi:MAG TPA: polysaccharide biosynthesis tyrosine autokinase [Verrucomicrobiae bacterium]
MLPGVKQAPIKFGDLMVYLTVVIKHIRLIVLLMAFSLLAGLTLYVYSRPVYYAKTLIERKELPLPVTTQTVFGDSTTDSLFYQFSSPHLTERTAARFGINMPYKYVYRKHIKKVSYKINSQGNVEIEVWAFSRDLAEFWTERMLEEYNIYRQEQRQKRREMVLNDFTKEMASISKKMEEWVATNFAYQDSNKMAEITSQMREMQAVPVELTRVNYVIEELQSLKARLTKPDLNVVEKLSILSANSGLLDLKIGATFDVSEGLKPIGAGADANAKTREFVIIPAINEAKGPVTWDEAERRFRSLKQERDQLSQRYLAAHPKMKEVEEKLKNAEQQLKAELEGGIQKVDVRLAELSARQADLKAKMPEYLETKKQQAKVQLGFDQLAAGQLAWRGFYDSLAKAVSTLDYGENKERIFLNYAGILEERLSVPASPNRFNLLLYAFILGLGLAVGVPFLIEYLDHTIGTVEVGEDSLKLRALGVVPQLSQRGVQDKAQGESELATMTENFRVIRTNLLFNGEADSDSKVIMVASAMPQEGKTYVARNIATSFARKGERTLLVDADIRRGTVHQAFKVASTPGLAEIIMDKNDAASAIRKTDIPNLDVIPRGKFSEEVTDRFGSEKVHNFIESLREKYDRVIIDTPPVLGLAETSSLLSSVDGVVFVIWSGRTPLRNVRIAIETLRSNGAQFYGFVLNRLDLTATSNYYYYYYYSHNYYESYHPAERAS